MLANIDKARVIFMPPIFRVSSAFLLLGSLFCSVVSCRAQSDQAVQPQVEGAPKQNFSYQTTWIGNTFGGGDKWVQNFIEGMFVAPDGTVYTASGWDEAGREFGIYKDGKIAGTIPDTHGWGTGGGKAIAANDTHVFIAHSHGNEGGGLTGEPYPAKGMEWYGVSRRNKDGSHAPFPGGRGRFGDMLVLHEVATDAGNDAQVRGLAVDDKNRLYISDTRSGEIKVLDTRSMTQLASWKVERPGPLALDKSESLWILQQATGSAPARVVRYSSNGVLKPQSMNFKAGVVPTSLALDGKGALYVTDNGPAQQMLIYTNLHGTPKLARTFGERGGIYSGKVPGKNGPQRFSGPMGVGLDAAGNLYVGCDQAAGGAVLRSFNPRGTLRWEVLGLEFVDSADTDPLSDGSDVWTTENRYTLDWSKPTGQQWTWRSQTVDPFRFPDDPRLNESITISAVRCFGA
jgi:hypothetical protein